MSKTAPLLLTGHHSEGIVDWPSTVVALSPYAGCQLPSLHTSSV